MTMNPTYEELKNRVRSLEQADRARREIQDELAQIFSLSLDLICIADIETTTFLRVNPAFTEILGYSEQELLNRSFLDFIHPEDIEATRSVVDRKLQRGARVINFENRYRCKDGTYRWLSWVSQPNPEKGVTIAVARDITERKRNEEELERSKALLDSTGRMAKVGGWELDAKTFDVSWTEETYRIHEVPPGHSPRLQEAINFFHPEDRRILERAIRDALEKGEPYDMEIRFITAKGNHLWTRTICQPEVRNGETVRLLGTFQDITARREVEEALRRSEKELQQILDATTDGIWTWDFRSDTMTFSSKYYTMLGYRPGEFSATFESWVDLVHRDDREQAVATAMKFLETKPDIYENEFRLRTKGGDFRWIRTRARIIERDGRGDAVFMIGNHEDVTERKQAESSLKGIEWLLESSPRDSTLSPQDYGDLTDLNRDGAILDSVGRDVLTDVVRGHLDLLDTSAAVYEQNGDYAHGIFSSGWCRMLDAASRNLCGTDDNAAALSSGKWLCHESCWEDASKVSIRTGKPVDVECHGGLRIHAVPIKARGKPIGSINFGYGDPPRDSSRIARIAEKYRVDTKTLQKEAEAYESRPKFIVEIAKKRLESSAKLLGALVESHLLQTDLQKERERLNVTLQSIGDGVITTDIEGRVILLNTVAETLTGWRQPESSGKRIDEIFHIVNEHTREPCENPVAKVLATGGVIGLANDTLLLARDGTERVVADSGAPIIDADGETIGVVLVFRDITEKIKLEAELRHAHKLEAIGNLAGGIAHEFNNVLGIIIGNVELAIDDLKRWNPVRENLEEIKLASLRAKDVVKQLLTFGRKMDIKREPINTVTVVKETLKLLRAAIPSYVRIREILPDDIDPVVADPTQIHQLLINLCNNAAQAMSEEGGTLTIELRNTVLDYEAASKHPDLRPGVYVRVSVRDTGHGIPSEVLDKIFDPYFTTKDIGKGTGMGLAVVHGIVQAHKGAIDIVSGAGAGTAFHVYLPSSKASTGREVSGESEIPTGSERILFVDDEESIVRLSENLLGRLGYSVSTSTDPLQVIDLFRTRPDDFDLVISDMTMESMTGDRLAIELLKIRPDIPIIICTGFSEKMSPEKAKQMGIKELLMKPIRRSALARAVRRALDESPRRR